MSSTRKPIWPYAIVALLCIPLFFLNIHDLHSWGDDFSQYIKQAVNIAEGRPYYESNNIFNPNHPDYGPPQYPPGFSLLLAPAVKIWGLSIKHMLYVVSACLAVLLFTLFAFYRKYTNDITAICLALLCVYAGCVIEHKSAILSDIPCWMFVAIYFTLRKSNHFSVARIVLLVLAATMAILTRTQAMSVIIAEGLYLFVVTVDAIRKKQFSLKEIINSVSFKVSVFTIALFTLLDHTLLRSPKSTLQFYSQLLTYHQASWAEAIAANLAYYHDMLLHVFHYYSKDPLLMGVCTLAVYLILTFIVIGFIMTIRKRFGISHAFVIVMSILVAILSQRQGIRFILYIMPFLLLYAHCAMHAILPRLLNVAPTKLAVVLTVIYLFLGKDDFTRFAETPGDYMPAPRDLAAFNFIRQHVSDSDLIIFNKPRALTLFTNKRTIVAPWMLSYAANKAYFDKIPGRKYVLINDAIAEQSDYFINAPKHAADTFEIAEGYHLYLLKDE